MMTMVVLQLNEFIRAVKCGGGGGGVVVVLVGGVDNAGVVG
jgi:hypothetical protein